MDYDFAILDFDDESEEAAARRRGWIEATLRGFREDRPEDALIDRWVTSYRADHVIVRGAWLPRGEFGAGPMPVATYASFDKTLNAGRELLPLRMITDVTTSAAHRRKGLLRRMIEDDLADAVAQGVPMAALTASEATIYGRWGFGAATLRTGVEVDTSAGFGFRSFTDSGRVELVEPADAWPHVKAVFDTFHTRERGSVEWPAPYEDMHSAAFDFQSGGPNRKLRAAVHLDSAGRVDGFLLFKPDEKESVKVDEMAALTPEAQLAFWSFLGNMDRVTKVTFNLFHPEDPLVWALTDMARVKVTEVEEFLWLRVLDLPRCLAARPWAADGAVVLEVDDPQGHAAGRFEVVTSDGAAQVTRTEQPADVRLTVETLASLYLSEVEVRRLHHACRLEGTDDAVAGFAAMADLPTPPYNLTGF